MLHCLTSTGSLGAPDNLEMASEMVTITVSSMQKQFALLDIRGIVTAKVGAFCARHSEKDYSDLEFLGQAFPVGVQQVSQQLNLAHRQGFINAYIARNQGPSSTGRVGNMKRVYGSRSSILTVWTFLCHCIDFDRAHTMRSTEYTHTTFNLINLPNRPAELRLNPQSTFSL